MLSNFDAPGQETNLEATHNPKAVSYTHLDVYKRQMKGRVVLRKLQLKQDNVTEW